MKNKAGIRALIFDWGGVIQCTADQLPRQQLARELGLAPETLEQAVFGSEAWAEASRGQRSAEAAWRIILADLGLSEESMAGWIQRFFAGDRLNYRLLEGIRWWRAKGIKVGLLSNALPPLPESIRRLWAKEPNSEHLPQPACWGLPGFFDAQVFSYQVGVLKPDPRAYEAVLSALDVPAEVALMIDDSADNVMGARRVGMEALCFQNTERLLADLDRLGLPLPPFEGD
ncbi:MAG: HAD family phosphatase [Chloroflexi bacterium]|nr:HAD family phosphatase [Chloroflexota bacterium]